MRLCDAQPASPLGKAMVKLGGKQVPRPGEKRNDQLQSGMAFWDAFFARVKRIPYCIRNLISSGVIFSTKILTPSIVIDCFFIGKNRFHANP